MPTMHSYWPCSCTLLSNPVLKLSQQRQSTAIQRIGSDVASRTGRTRTKTSHSIGFIQTARREVWHCGCACHTSLLATHIMSLSGHTSTFSKDSISALRMTSTPASRCLSAFSRKPRLRAKFLYSRAKRSCS